MPTKKNQQGSNVSPANSAHSQGSADVGAKATDKQDESGMAAGDGCPSDDSSASQSDGYPSDEPSDRVVLTDDDFIDNSWMDIIGPDPSTLDLSIKAQCFHNINAKGEATGVVDNRIYEYIVHTHNIFVCGGIPYLYSDGYYKADQRGTSIKSMIKDCCLEQFVRSTTIERIYKLFLLDCRIEKTADDLNDYESNFINFENGMYNAVTRKLYDHYPSILSVNQIPWSYDPNADPGPGTEIEKFLHFAIPDEDDREMLLEYIGLCCTKDVRQQKMLVICGDGGTGKSTIINLIQEIVGKRNTSNVAMSKLSENFQAIRMMGKLLNSCADLEIDALDDVTMIKKLIGEDAISDSYKGKDVISFDNYAKLLFSTNELPLVRNEKTGGFYRRLLVLTMNEAPEKRDPELYKRLRNEIPYLIHISMEALRRMYKRGYILVSQNSVEKTQQLRKDSDTIEAFLSECIEVTNDQKDRISRPIMFEKYAEYCKDWERQAHTKKNFFTALRNKGLKDKRMSSGVFYLGLRLRPERPEENGQEGLSVDEQGFIEIPEGMQMNEAGIPFPA